MEIPWLTLPLDMGKDHILCGTVEILNLDILLGQSVHIIMLGKCVSYQAFLNLTRGLDTVS